MLYFNCGNCGAEVRVAPSEAQKDSEKSCPACGAKLVFANHELKEGQMLVLFRCHNQACPGVEQPQELPITRTSLREMCQHGSDMACRHCGEPLRFSDQEKANTLKKLDEEAVQGSLV